MTKIPTQFSRAAKNYLTSLNECITDSCFDNIENLAKDILQAWLNNKQVFICGNGGSAANALHIANDLFYGIGACGSAPIMPGVKAEALPASIGIVTCLANDTGYENIFSHQLAVKADPGDVLLVLSGSGNSKNVVNAIQKSKDLNMKSHAIVAFDGGKCKQIAENTIHFHINDMQIAEDTQLIVGHICMQWLNKHKPQKT